MGCYEYNCMIGACAVVKVVGTAIEAADNAVSEAANDADAAMMLQRGSAPFADST